MIEHPRAALFDPAEVVQDGEQQHLAQGRGEAVFFRHNGLELVLKHYRRGGRMAALLGDRYIGTDCGRSRSFREWRLLQRLRLMELPVPAPVAASCVRFGLFYRADLITRQINDVVTLADHLREQPCDEPAWRAVGACIRRFHNASVYHADLNARNILLDDTSKAVYLVDFDKGALRYMGEAWKAANLARLQRSLLKFKSLHEVFHYEPENWESLLDGYKNTENKP